MYGFVLVYSEQRGEGRVVGIGVRGVHIRQITRNVVRVEVSDAKRRKNVFRQTRVQVLLVDAPERVHRSAGRQKKLLLPARMIGHEASHVIDAVIVRDPHSRRERIVFGHLCLANHSIMTATAPTNLFLLLSSSMLTMFPEGGGGKYDSHPGAKPIHRRSKLEI